MSSSATKNMIQAPIALEWTIAEDRLKAVKDSVIHYNLESDKFTAFHASDVQYFLQVYPNGNGESLHNGRTLVYLRLYFGNEKRIEADFTLSVESANWSHKMNVVFETMPCWGGSCCSVDQLFDPNSKFIVDGKFTIKVEGILKIQNVEIKLARKILKPKRKIKLHDLWKSGFEDCCIVAEGKEIEIHRNVIACQSSVFATMFKSSTKEAKEKKFEISDFPFSIVEKALQLCYQHIPLSDVSPDECFSLIKFFNKYDMVILANNLEECLGDKLTVSNVSEIASYAFTRNDTKLRNKCLDFITDCVSRKQIVPNKELLDKNFMITVIDNTALHKSLTL